MNRITLNFKNLCAVFTKKLNNNEVMVGLLDLTLFPDVPEKDLHSPKITIETEKKIISPNGEEVQVPQVWTYAGFSKNDRECFHHGETDLMHQPSNSLGPLFGNIGLEIYRPGGNCPLAGLSHELSRGKIAELTRMETDRRRKTGEIKPAQNVTVTAFDSVLDFQKRLHQGDTLNVLPELCKARFYFHYGLLYAVSTHSHVPMKFNPPNQHADNQSYPTEIALEIDIPEDGYAVLRFLNSDTRDFIFQGKDQHYYVTIENSPATHPHPNSINHFEYYYKLISRPQMKYRLDISGGSVAGDPFCMVIGFGDADY